MQGDERCVQLLPALLRYVRAQRALHQDHQVAEHRSEGLPPANVERIEESFFREQRVACQTGLAAAIVDRALLREK
ncbi:hypothetical protein D3C83_205640 [compost metagenome]